MKDKILLVEDDGPTRIVLTRILEMQGFQVLSAEGGQEALLVAEDSQPDLILSDVTMDGKSGLDLCREIKQNPRTFGIPIILLSGSRMEDADQIRAFQYGADDYLLKPVQAELLASKIRSVLQRFTIPSAQLHLSHVEGLTVNTSARTVSVQGKTIALRRKEFDLLLTFLHKRGRVLSHAHLLETVWQRDSAQCIDFSTVKVHVSALRKKLGPRLGKKIVAVPGHGYRFDKQEADS